MDKLSAMQIFVRVADSRSFSKAAAVSAVSQSTVSKQIAQLETRLGAQLLRRTTRGLSLTEAGQDYYESAVKLLEGIEESENRIARGQVDPAGLLRVAISPAFGRFYVIPHLPEFFSLYPDVSIDFDISHSHSNLIGDGVDLAIRIGELSDSSLVARRIGQTRLATVATPDYLERHGVPMHPRLAERLPCVVYMFQGIPRAWRFSEDGLALHVDARAVVRSNDAEHLREAVLSGLGLGHNPGWLYASDLAAGRLHRVLEHFSPPPFPISALSPAGRRQPRKAQVFTDFLAEKFSTIPELTLAQQE